MAKRGIKPLLKPHIVETYYDENGRVIGYVADNCVEHDPAKVQEHLDNIGRIWAEAEAWKAMQNMGQTTEQIKNDVQIERTSPKRK